MLDDVLTRLEARLPELEWKLTLRGTMIHPSLLPRGLFLNRIEMTAQTCIDEIKLDLETIKNQKNELSAHFIAERVNKKINVLVRLCRQNNSPGASEKQAVFGVQTLGTRQQWLQNMQKNIDVLAQQHNALQTSLNKLDVGTNPQLILSLQTELGEINRRLTLAKETFARSTTF